MTRRVRKARLATLFRLTRAWAEARKAEDHAFQAFHVVSTETTTPATPPQMARYQLAHDRVRTAEHVARRAAEAMYRAWVRARRPRHIGLGYHVLPGLGLVSRQ